MTLKLPFEDRDSISREIRCIEINRRLLQNLAVIHRSCKEIDGKSTNILWLPPQDGINKLLYGLIQLRMSTHVAFILDSQFVELVTLDLGAVVRLRLA